MNKLLSLVILTISLSLVGCAEQIDEGYRGIKTHWGSVEKVALNPGIYFYLPISSNIFEIDVREHKFQSKTPCFTRDTQNVEVEFVVTYYPIQDKITDLYSQFGLDWDAKVVNQIVLGSIKDTIGQYIADDIVSKRELAKNTAQEELRKALALRHVILTRLDFTNLDFDDQYEKAVEAKVTAIQRASEAKNRTVQIEEEAKQKIKSAEADARAMQIKSQALSQNRGLVDFEAVQKWDGKLPEVMFGSSVPILNLENLKKHTP
jgi:regulator of protease activity HflC (stomatin/prohibitin superfamily)